MKIFSARKLLRITWNRPDMKALNFLKLTLIVPLLLMATCALASSPQKIDLSGQWDFLLDRDGTVTPGFRSTESVSLPGTTDTNLKGDKLSDSGMTTHLSRKYSYKGKAWYRRDVMIPDDWKGDSIYLFIERTKPSQIFVDHLKVGESNNISTPQEFNLTPYLTPGKHTIAVMIDNSSGVPEQIYASSHAYTEDTQTNWNGMIGEMYLSTTPLSASLHAPANEEVNPAFRNFEIRGRQFYADGHPVFLRGRHDACVWPLTGHVAMDKASWQKYFEVCKQYGLNHVRFHSWCPPEAAFAAADEAGIYLQPELPFWGDFNSQDSTLMSFLHKEGENILRTYGHHPSFRMFALGNELWGDIDKMGEFVADFRKIAPDKVYTFGSNYYLGYQGVKPGMDFFVTCRVGGEKWGEYNTHTRGSFSFADAADGGMINHFYPDTRRNFEEGCSLSEVPVISHETAQFQTYPDYDEIKKYTGVLAPVNLEIFRARLDSAGLASQAKLFHEASGKWSVELYKQDIEMDLRTPSMAGFQLLDLQDYPGQGSAYVGILDAFLDSKGLVTPEEWRGWCSEVVPMLNADKFCFTTKEGLKGDVSIANYSGHSLEGRKLSWTLGDKTGTMTIPSGEGLIKVGELDIDLSDIAKASNLKLTLSVEGHDTPNRYNIWVYPDNENLTELRKGILIADSITDEVAKTLKAGGKVMLTLPASANTVGALFQTDYWNYRMFKTISENNHKEVSPGTLGILTDPEHPVFKEFPTDMHTNWQWFPILKNSNPFILDNAAKGYTPIVQVIDNIERNHKLGLVFEYEVEGGKVLVVMADLDKAAQTPEGRQFEASLLKYMNSHDFNPADRISIQDFRKLLSSDVETRKLEELNNISPY